MNGIQVTVENGGRWRLTATDGKLLAIVRGPSAPCPQDEEAAAKLPPVEALVSSAIIPVKDFSQAMRAVPKPRQGPQGEGREGASGRHPAREPRGHPHGGGYRVPLPAR